MPKRSVPTLAQPAARAQRARSALACPAAVWLSVDGVPDERIDREDVALQDDGGVPLLSVAPDSAVAVAAARVGSAVLTLAGGAPGADDTVRITGRLRTRGTQDCACCDEVRHLVSLEPVAVVLVSGASTGGGELSVPLAAYRSPEHALNAGYLLRSQQHANDCHGQELRQAVSAMTGTPVQDLAAALLADLRADGVELRWTDLDGGHSLRVDFPRRASSVQELGEMLRSRLHGGLC